jgi:lysophospholipase L1-like esterase
MRIPSNSKLLFIGDSVTDCGRTQPVGEGLGEALGKGYVSLVDALLTATYPAHNVRVVNVGTSGHTVRELAGRWQRDVLDLKPDFVSVMIGINDVWRQFDSPRRKEIHVLPDEYKRTLRELVAQTRPRVQGLVLMTPFYIEPNRQDAMRARMDEYGTMVRTIAEEQDAIFVDTQAAFDAVLQSVYPATIAWDRVHPSPTGHIILARAFLNAVGYEWSGTGS